LNIAIAGHATPAPAPESETQRSVLREADNAHSLNSLLLRSRRQNDIGPDSASAKESKLLTQSGLAKFVGSWACRCLPSNSTGHVSVKPCCKNSTITLNSKQEPLRIEDCKGTPMVVLSDKRTFVHRHEEKGADGSLVSVTWVSTKDSTEEIKWDRKSCKHGFGANNQKH
jgi:hypothetical protein